MESGISSREEKMEVEREIYESPREEFFDYNENLEDLEEVIQNPIPVPPSATSNSISSFSNSNTKFQNVNMHSANEKPIYSTPNHTSEHSFDDFLEGIDLEELDYNPSTVKNRGAVLPSPAPHSLSSSSFVSHSIKSNLLSSPPTASLTQNTNIPQSVQISVPKNTQHALPSLPLPILIHNSSDEQKRRYFHTNIH